MPNYLISAWFVTFFLNNGARGEGYPRLTPRPRLGTGFLLKKGRTVC
jgi:hypothetical protein